MLGAAYPWVARRLLTDTSPELRSTLLSLLYKGGAFNFGRLESLIRQAVRPEGRAQPARGAAPGAPPPRGDALALLLSPDGAFIRNIMVEELAKGIDSAVRLAADEAVASARQGLAAGQAPGQGLGLGFGLGPLPPPPGSTAAAAALAELLAAVPLLEEAGDREQVEGILGLLRVLQVRREGRK